jgi:hypothetical protein
MKIHDVNQGSIEWLRLRTGKLTGTRLKELMAKDNLGLIDELIAENVTGFIENNFVSAAMELGIAREPEARKMYEQSQNILVENVGFIESDKFNYLGCSPDGLIKENGKFVGSIEIKCPSVKTHVKYIRQNQIPNEYKYQVLNYFLCAEEIEWLDFISFNPEFTPKKMFIHRVHRKYITEELNILEESIIKFWDKFLKYQQQIIF